MGVLPTYSKTQKTAPRILFCLAARYARSAKNAYLISLKKIRNSRIRPTETGKRTIASIR